MKFSLNLRTDNDAFEPDPRPELSRILREIAERIDNGDDIECFRTILDANGNDVGRFALKPDSYR